MCIDQKHRVESKCLRSKFKPNLNFKWVRNLDLRPTDPNMPNPNLNFSWVRSCEFEENKLFTAIIMFKYIATKIGPCGKTGAKGIGAFNIGTSSLAHRVATSFL